MTTPDSALIPGMVAERAAADPDAVAVLDGAQTLSYAQLLDGATRVAHQLRQRGAGRDQVVGLTGPRSALGVVGMLGILTAGAAYAYLDPGWPRERRRHVVRECRIRSAVAAGTSRAGLGLATARVADPDPAGWCDPEPLTVHQPGDLCYVVYTSGSTGAPKGVAVEHRGAANMATQLARIFQVTPGVRMLQFASWAWDAAACEILVTLTAGGTLVLAPDDVRRGGDELAAFLREQRVNVATLTPSLLAALSEQNLPDLRNVVAVGEACPAELVTRWAADGRRCLTGYGPTEATVAVSVGECRPGEPVTIGAPLPGVTVRVVDPSGAAAPAGEAGELLVGGVGLARGYLPAPDHATDPPAHDPADGPADGPVDGPVVGPAGRFVTDADGARWYRTGDLVRQRADGVLLFVGRRDEQVQVHGHRVELGEVAHAIRRHALVGACAVAVQGGRLVAYVHGDDPALTAADVATAAARWLPAHMRPDVRVAAEWPLTAQGKLDLAALTSHTHPATPPGGSDPTSPPDGAVADALDLVRSLLESEAVGADDDFFDAGGHSLLAAQLAVELGHRFGVMVSAQMVAEHRTARRLAALIAQPALVGRR